MSNANNIDLNNLVTSGGYKVKIESIEEEHQDDAKIRRRKDWCLFLATLFFMFVLYSSCIGFIFFKPSSPHAGTALNGIIGLTIALAGYYVGGKK